MTVLYERGLEDVIVIKQISVLVRAMKLSYGDWGGGGVHYLSGAVAVGEVDKC